MKNWVISYILALGLQLSVYAGDENIRAFRTVDPMQLEKKVPPGYGHVFLQAGRQYNIDPVVLAAISAHESGRWKSRVAQKKNNWMGLMTRREQRVSRPQKSRFSTLPSY